MLLFSILSCQKAGGNRYYEKVKKTKKKILPVLLKYIEYNKLETQVL